MIWTGNSINECLRTSYGNMAMKSIKDLPLLVAWGIWLSRNASLFDDKFILPLQCAMHILIILNGIKQLKDEMPSRKIEAEVINKSKSWIYFHGATQGDL